MSDERRHNDEAILAELRGLKDLFLERTGNQDQRLIRIETQVLKTNGRVNTLELEAAEIRGKAKISGVLWGAVTSVIVTTIGFFITRSFK